MYSESDEHSLHKRIKLRELEKLIDNLMKR